MEAIPFPKGRVTLGMENTISKGKSKLSAWEEETLSMEGTRSQKENSTLGMESTHFQREESTVSMEATHSPGDESTLSPSGHSDKSSQNCWWGRGCLCRLQICKLHDCSDQNVFKKREVLAGLGGSRL